MYKERICTNDKYHKEKKWEDGDLGTTMTTGWALQAAFITFRVASKVWKKDLDELITFFYPIICSSLFQSWYQKVNIQLGRMELNIKSSRHYVRIRPRHFVRFKSRIFSHFLLSSYSALSMETGHSIEFRDMETISIWLFYNSTSTCDMPYSCPWNTMLVSRSHILPGYLQLRYPGILGRRKWRPKEEMGGNGRAREGEEKVLLLFY